MACQDQVVHYMDRGHVHLPIEGCCLEVAQGIRQGCAPCGLISEGHLNKIIFKYHILPYFIYRVPNHDEYVFTPSAFEVAFCE